ncbi:rod-determining factor RdfA [Halorarius halobius]|uniref:rod-determining factor RdfA n=1 Tax=Halorarius halobius TaxID=2962671 RepID=UPI0020CCB465|nr:rod-determining factor RdfA [Halorarius halobius]
MGDSTSSTTGSAGRRTKVGRLIDEYDLVGVGGEMEQRWTAEGDERSSLRDLADYFNRRLLESAMDEAGLQPLAGEVENVYRLLDGEDVSEADRTRATRRLEREGVDIEQLRGEFVTYQAVRTYLKDHRGAEYEQADRDRTEAETENLQRIKGRATTVTESKLEQLRTADEITLGEFRTFVDINVLCEECDAQYGVEELLQRGGCDCPDD